MTLGRVNKPSESAPAREREQVGESERNIAAGDSERD